MSEEYLWDGSGAPDAEVERLEKLLGGLRATAAEFKFPAASMAATSPLATRSRRTEWLRIAAAAVLLLGSIWLLRALTGRAEWTIAGLEGSPRIDGKLAERNQGWKIGQSLETDETSRGQLGVERRGEFGEGPT